MNNLTSEDLRTILIGKTVVRVDLGTYDTVERIAFTDGTSITFRGGHMDPDHTWFDVFDAQGNPIDRL